jgi:hypothetical protein
LDLWAEVRLWAEYPCRALGASVEQRQAMVERRRRENCNSPVERKPTFLREYHADRLFEII